MTSLEWGPAGSRVDWGPESSKARRELETFLQELGDERRGSTKATIAANLRSSLDPLGHPHATVRPVANRRKPSVAVQDVLTAVPVFEHPKEMWAVVIYGELGSRAIILGLFRNAQVPNNPGTVQVKDSDWNRARRRWEELG